MSDFKCLCGSTDYTIHQMLFNSCDGNIGVIACYCGRDEPFKSYGFDNESVTKDAIDAFEKKDRIAELEMRLAKLEDYHTHHGSWVNACEIAKENAAHEDDAGYWQHQLITLENLRCRFDSPKPQPG